MSIAGPGTPCSTPTTKWYPTEHQQHTALVTAIVAYGIANLDEQLTREGVYLEDGLYADITTGKGRIITTLDYPNAPVQVAHFIRLIEGREQQRPAAAGGRQGPGGRTIGRIESVAGGVVGGVIESETQASLGRVNLPRVSNPTLPHDRPGILGLTSQNRFYLTLTGQPAFDRNRTAIGQVIAGASVLDQLAADDEIRGVRIIRVGEDARAFSTDDASFNQLLRRR
jgi:cyclophilin family peptidyl-prolyl cis-trans isomerase